MDTIEAPQPDISPQYMGLLGFIRLFYRFAKISFVHWSKILLLILFGQSQGVLWVVSAMSTAKCVDEGLQVQDKQGFLMWAMIWFGVQIILYLIYNFSTIISAYIKLRVDQNLKLQIFDCYQKHGLRFQLSRPIGENMFRINNDTTLSATVAASVVPDIATRIIAIITTASLLFTLNKQLAFAVVGYVGLFFIFQHLVTTYSTRFQAQVRHRGEDTIAMLQENLSAYVISKAMGRAKHDSRRYFNRVAKLARATANYGITYGMCMTGLRFMWDVFLILAQMLFCGWLIIQSEMSIGEYVAVGQVLFFVVAPLQLLVFTVIWLRVSAVTLRRMLETLDVDPEIKDDPDAVDLVDPQGEIVFENVSFRYTDDGPDVIQDLSMRVPPGKKLAIVGPSGAGKTSIFNLIMRYYEPSRGRILIDGNDLKKLKLDSYRDHLSIVIQDNFMYSATIRDNILFGNPHASEEQLAQAIELAGLQPMLDEMSDGLNTILKEGGDLSAGQLQRIGIARAVIRNPRFLFLDEATSSLDPATEDEILKQLKLIEEGRTRLVIAHSIASVKDSDQIIVMEHGRLIQQGTHEELVNEEGIYATMWAAEKEKMAMDVTDNNQGGPNA